MAQLTQAGDTLLQETPYTPWSAPEPQPTATGSGYVVSSGNTLAIIPPAPNVGAIGGPGDNCDSCAHPDAGSSPAIGAGLPIDTGSGYIPAPGSGGAPAGELSFSTASLGATVGSSASSASSTADPAAVRSPVELLAFVKAHGLALVLVLLLLVLLSARRSS